MAAADWKPSRKVAGGGVAGAVTTVVLWLVDELTPLSPPAAVASAISVLVTFGVAYWIPAAARVDEPPLTDDERQAVLRAYHQAAQSTPITLRVSGSAAAEQDLIDTLRQFLERRPDQGV